MIYTYFKGLLPYILLMFGCFLTAQNSFDELVTEGIKFHDNGEYDNAISSYKKALKVQPNSPLVFYELSLTYFTIKDYQNAIEYSDKVLKEKNEYLIHAYVTKGSSLDMIGKTKESIKLFKKALKKEGEDYLLRYNLALNYLKINDLELAEQHVTKAIEANNNHTSSHLMLSNINEALGNRVQSILAKHYFLLLEPNSNRSQIAYLKLIDLMGANVKRDNEKPNSINITLSSDISDDFGAAELMLSMLEASKTMEDNEGKTENELFIENTTSFFKTMGELRKKTNKGIWWNFYTPFFYELSNSEHMEAYCNYIAQSSNKISRQWVNQNPNKIKALFNWLNKS